MLIVNFPTDGKKTKLVGGPASLSLSTESKIMCYGLSEKFPNFTT